MRDAVENDACCSLLRRDSTILNGALLSFPGQLNAEGSTLQWIARAKAIAVWAGTTSEGMGLGPLAGGLLLVVTSLTSGSAVRVLLERAELGRAESCAQLV